MNTRKESLPDLQSENSHHCNGENCIFDSDRWTTQASAGEYLIE
jgi:hypothetical protein